MLLAYPLKSLQNKCYPNGRYHNELAIAEMGYVLIFRTEKQIIDIIDMEYFHLLSHCLSKKGNYPIQDLRWGADS